MLAEGSFTVFTNIHYCIFLEKGILFNDVKAQEMFKMKFHLKEENKVIKSNTGFNELRYSSLRVNL